MKTVTKCLSFGPPEVLRDVIERFVEAAQQRGECQFSSRRRSLRRYQRSWPLTVVIKRDLDLREFGVALYNASRQGVAFLFSHRIDIGSTVYLRLFWHDDECPYVPAVVRHSTATPTGYLVGCEFMLRDHGYDSIELDVEAEE